MTDREEAINATGAPLDAKIFRARKSAGIYIPTMRQVHDVFTFPMKLGVIFIRPTHRLRYGLWAGYSKGLNCVVIFSPPATVEALGL